MFDNVTYEFYTNVLKRSIIPTQEEFDSHAMLNIAYYESLNSVYVITPHSENGIDSAICMMCEVDYQTDKALTGEENSGRVSGVSVGSVSESYDKSYANAVIAANVKPAELQKMDYLKLFCHVYCGVR